MAHLAVLAKIRNISAVGAATVAEARSLIQEAPPQVVVLDMRLPDGTGLDVIAALEAASANALVIVASAYLDDYRGKLPRSERVHLLGKPVPMHELRRIVESAVTNTSMLSPFTVLDYVQLACMGHHSAVIECYGGAGRGEIIIEKGELWSAEDRQGNGVAAFERLLMAKRANARPLTDRRQLPARNLVERWELMVLDTLRAQDEQGTKPLPKLPSAVQPSSPAPAKADAAGAAPTPSPPTPATPAGKGSGVPAIESIAKLAPTAPAAAPSVPPAAVSAVAPPAASVDPPASGPAAESRPVVPASIKVQPPAASAVQVPAKASTEASSTRSLRSDDQFDACVERALRAVVAKNFAQAIAELEKAQALRPGDPLVTHRLARLRSLQG